ncbi:MAG: hypothetical protein CM1200mP30_13120 [Pseudomonadota bacterium]|nr:MAG: hypothetical protein CM1200mP30_13120 [Pseudomonadota bacterium]
MPFSWRHRKLNLGKLGQSLSNRYLPDRFRYIQQHEHKRSNSRRAMQLVEGKFSVKVHPNDHINFGQSLNDTFPTAIRIAGFIEGKK